MTRHRIIGLFPEEPADRKTYPIYAGLLAYFPSALAAVARHSFVSNARHNPGQPLHHDRAKSGDEADALLRHLMEGDYVGMAWRALALLQKDLEAKGAPIAPGARNAVATAETEHHAVDAPLPPFVSEIVSPGIASAILRDKPQFDPEREDDTGEPYPDPRPNPVSQEDEE